jgi:hypothetical protein
MELIAAKTSGRHAGIGVAELGAHRAVIDAGAFLALGSIDRVDLFDVADGPVRALGFARTTCVAEIGDDCVGHDILLGYDGIFALDALMSVKLKD